MNIAVLGTGVTGQTIASKLVRLGHEVMLGSRDPAKPAAVTWARDAGQHALYGTFQNAAEFGEIIFNLGGRRSPGFDGGFFFSRGIQRDNEFVGVGKIRALSGAEQHFSSAVLADVREVHAASSQGRAIAPGLCKHGFLDGAWVRRNEPAAKQQQRSEHSA